MRGVVVVGAVGEGGGHPNFEDDELMLNVPDVS